jgi:hypothetical protein
MKAESASQRGTAVRAAERRKHPRKGSFWHAQLQTPEGNFDCRVTNLSPRGARIEIDQPVAHGQLVTLIMEPLGEFTGVVAWRRNGSLGIHISEHRTTRTQIAFPRWVAEGEAQAGRVEAPARRAR